MRTHHFIINFYVICVVLEYITIKSTHKHQIHDYETKTLPLYLENDTIIPILATSFYSAKFESISSMLYYCIPQPFLELACFPICEVSKKWELRRRMGIMSALSSSLKFLGIRFSLDSFPPYWRETFSLLFSRMDLSNMSQSSPWNVGSITVFFFLLANETTFCA